MLVDEELGEISKPQEKALRAMDECVRRLRGILDNVVDVIGLETGRMKFLHNHYDLLATVKRAVAAQASVFQEKRLSVALELPAGPLPAFGDAERLGRAIQQLLDNAAKFTPEGGGVGLGVWEDEASYELVIADTGPGVALERVDRIFDAFYQVDGTTTRAHGGVGVGLAIVRRVARGLGGDVKVEQGATINGTFFPGAAFAMTIAKRAPTVLDASG
jgi:signal transduction histidine kinase